MYRRSRSHGKPYQYSYNPPAGFNAKTAVVSQAGMDGGDGGWAMLYGSNPLPAFGGTLDVAIDEDQIANSERKHTTEQVAYFIIDPPVQEAAASLVSRGFAVSFLESMAVTTEAVPAISPMDSVQPVDRFHPPHARALDAALAAWGRSETHDPDDEEDLALPMEEVVEDLLAST